VAEAGQAQIAPFHPGHGDVQAPGLAGQTAGDVDAGELGRSLKNKRLMAMKAGGCFRTDGSGCHWKQASRAEGSAI